jgi:hypothetical protein
VKLFKGIQMARTKDDLFKISYEICLHELFPLWVKDFQLYLFNPETNVLKRSFPLDRHSPDNVNGLIH